jgi:hypothetical protein
MQKKTKKKTKCKNKRTKHPASFNIPTLLAPTTTPTDLHLYAASAIQGNMTQHAVRAALPSHLGNNTFPSGSGSDPRGWVHRVGVI